MNDPHRNRQEFVAIGIAVLVAVGIFAALTSGVSLADGLLSLVVPVAAAAVLVAYRQPLGAAITHYLSENHQRDRAVTAEALRERDEALKEADAARRDARISATLAAESEAVNASLCGALENAYRELYDTTKGGQLTHLQLIRAMVTDLRLTRQKADMVDAITTERDNAVRERNDLRTALTDALNAPPPPLTWSLILPWVAYGHALPKPTVRKLRDEFRAKGIAIPDKEMGEFSAAVRAIPAPSPSGGVPAAPVVSGVKGEQVPTDASAHGRIPPLTDTRTRPRTARTTRAKALPTAAARGKIEAEA